jgi:NADPH:quinone reductase-like Zn-dependent oxidoreductase
MNRTQQTALAIGAMALGGAMVARGLRTSRRIEFRGRSVVITGGSRGLGLVMARLLAAEGARLTIAARDHDELLRAQADLAGYAAAPRTSQSSAATWACVTTPNG